MTEMKAYIDSQLRMLTRKLRDAYNKDFAEGSESIRLYRKEDMDYKEFEKMLMERMEQYEERLNGFHSADGLYEYSYDVEEYEERLGGDGKPLRWDVSVSWEFQQMENPFDEEL